MPGYDPDVGKNRAQTRQIMEKLGSGPDNRLKLTVSARNIPIFKRRKRVWEVDKQLQEDGARPVIYHFRTATCWQPKLKGLTIMVNSQYNGWRFEDLWLDE